MAQQTAVEWMVDNIFQSYLDGKIYCNGLDITEEIEQAKAMEKEQIMDAIINNQNGLLRRKTVLEAEQYYNETYNK